MAIVEIKIGSLSIQIESEEKEKIIDLTAELNNKINKLKLNFKGLTDIKALLIMALMLQDEIHKAENSSDSKAEDIVKKQDKEVRDSFNELIDNAIEKIDKLSMTLSK